MHRREQPFWRGASDIGREGVISYDGADNWRKVVEGGWTQKTEAGGGGGCLFEKCR